VCHCLFDLWLRSPKPVLEVADVDAVLSEAIELGSANLTYVWEDSTPGEQALMAGMAAATQHGSRPVTLDQVRDAWRTVTVSLPDRELAWALRSLTSREVVTGSQACSFTVDLQRLWLEKHRRLDWVKEELAETVQQWNQSAEPWPADTIPVQVGRPGPADTNAATGDQGPLGPHTGAKPRIPRRGRYLAIAAAVAVLASYLAAAAATHVFPFSPPTSSPTLSPTSQLLLLLPGDLRGNGHGCHAAGPPSQWQMPGLVEALHCTDPGLTGGNVYAYQLDNPPDLQSAWQNFNQWWGFISDAAGTTCPPIKKAYGLVSAKGAGLPEADRELTECGTVLNGNSYVPVFAWDWPDSDAFVIAEGASGSSFPELVSWLIHPAAPTSARPGSTATPAPSLAGNITPILQLLPSDIADPTTQCAAVKKPDWSSPGLVTALSCNDTGLPSGHVNGYQMDSRADYAAAWKNFNSWSSFDVSTAGSSCPPSGSGAQGITEWWNNALHFPEMQGQVVECWTGSNAAPIYVWTMPTQDAFFIAVGANRSSFKALDTWWVDNSAPASPPTALPTPSASPS
jgi:hypothetical protein